MNELYSVGADLHHGDSRAGVQGPGDKWRLQGHHGTVHQQHGASTGLMILFNLFFLFSILTCWFEVCWFGNKEAIKFIKVKENEMFLIHRTAEQKC